MVKIKKIHKIILFFILIFLLGVYSFTIYINHTIDTHKENKEHSEIKESVLPDSQVTELE